MKIIAPSILSADFTKLGEQINLVMQGGAEWIHCDVMDGKFVPNITFGPLVVNAVKKCTDKIIDVHLMIEKPENYLEEFAKAGADYITFHQEASIHIHRTVQQIKSLGAKAGISINPATPISVLEEVLEYIDLVLIMSVNPGFGGQKFIKSSFKKIEELDRIRKEKNYKFLIEIDGGINSENIKSISEKGCDVFVAGSAIFSKENIPEATAELRKLIN